MTRMISTFAWRRPNSIASSAGPVLPDLSRHCSSHLTCLATHYACARLHNVRPRSAGPRLRCWLNWILAERVVMPLSCKFKRLNLPRLCRCDGRHARPQSHDLCAWATLRQERGVPSQIGDSALLAPAPAQIAARPTLIRRPKRRRARVLSRSVEI